MDYSSRIPNDSDPLGWPPLPSEQELRDLYRQEAEEAAAKTDGRADDDAPDNDHQGGKDYGYGW